jgi:hypothetical protein
MHGGVVGGGSRLGGSAIFSSRLAYCVAGLACCRLGVLVKGYPISEQGASRNNRRAEQLIGS